MQGSSCMEEDGGYGGRCNILWPSPHPLETFENIGWPLPQHFAIFKCYPSQFHYYKIFQCMFPLQCTSTLIGLHELSLKRNFNWSFFVTLLVSYQWPTKTTANDAPTCFQKSKVSVQNNTETQETNASQRNSSKEFLFPTSMCAYRFVSVKEKLMNKCVYRWM